mgnify:CR=1 FL=1
MEIGREVIFLLEIIYPWEDDMPSPLESALTNQNPNEETTGQRKRKLSGDEGMVIIS